MYFNELLGNFTFNNKHVTTYKGFIKSYKKHSRPTTILQLTGILDFIFLDVIGAHMALEGTISSVPNFVLLFYVKLGT